MRLTFFTLIITGIPALSGGLVFAQSTSEFQILEPTQGRPKIVKADESFYFMFRSADENISNIDAILVSSLCEEAQIKLTADGPPMKVQGDNWVTMLKIPAQTPNGTYDLLINPGQNYQRISNAIKIIDKFKTAFRFIHISNMNIGDPSSPEFDENLINEINLLAPEFILATGDFVEKNLLGNGEQAWIKTKNFLSKFQSPCYILCGDQDDPESFTRLINPTLTGALDYGLYHFLLLNDNANHPIERDANELKTIAIDLENNQGAAVSFIIGNRDNLGLLDGLASLQISPSVLFAKAKVRYLIFGGCTDWDSREYIQKLSAYQLSNVKYVRTGQSSTCTKNGGSGTSQYRVFNVNGEHINYLYQNENADKAIQSSIPTGKLNVIHQGPNDGSRPLERAIIVNGLNQSFNNVRVIFKLAGTDPSTVRVLNGQIEQIFALPNSQLLVLARGNLPEKSSTQIMATANPELTNIYDSQPVKVTLNEPKRLTFSSAVTASGLKFFSAGETLTLTIKNTSKKPIKIKLKITLAGQELSVSEIKKSKVKTPNPPSTATVDQAGQIELQAEQSAFLSIRPALRNVSDGEHAIIVYQMNDPLMRTTAIPVSITVAGR